MPGSRVLSANYILDASGISAGVRSNHPGSGVQEFATIYYRQPPGSGGVAARATKSHIRKGHGWFV